MATYPPPVQIQKKRGPGCFGCGCGIVLLIVVLLIVLLAGLSYFFYRTAVSYTSPTGTVVQQFDGGDATFRTAQQKVIDFQEAYGANRPASLQLDADEINTLIAREPFLSRLKGRVFVSLKDDTATLQSSLPLSEIESFALQNRFVNGDVAVSFKYNPETSRFDLHIGEVHLTGHEIPASTIESLNRSIPQIVDQKLMADPKAQAFFARTQKFTIENGGLIIETK